MNPDLVPRELSVPPTLEERTVTALRANGLLRPPRRHSAAWVRIAAALVLFASGVGVGALWSSPPDPAAVPTQRYLLLLAGATNTQPGAETRAVTSYRAWAGQLRDEGRSVNGERLGAEAIVVPASAEATGASASAIQGFFVVSADRLEDAVRIAQSSPHAIGGGQVIVRPINTPP